jgi:CRP-like cAMP-binding protein
MEFSLLASLPEEARRTLLGNVRRRTFARREVIVHEGDPADSLHLVRSGRLAVQVSTPGGQVAMLRLITPGEYFGEVALLERQESRRSATIIALEPAETWSISSATFHSLRAQHPDIQQVVMTALAERVEDLSRRLLEAMYDGLDRRVFRQLVYLSDVYAQGTGGGPVTVPLTQETLAEFVGGTRPSVNSVLQRLQERGLIELTRGRIVVRDRAALAARLR